MQNWVVSVASQAGMINPATGQHMSTGHQGQGPYSTGQKASSMGPSRGGSRALNDPSPPLREGWVNSLSRKRTALTAGR